MYVVLSEIILKLENANQIGIYTLIFKVFFDSGLDLKKNVGECCHIWTPRLYVVHQMEDFCKKSNPESKTEYKHSI